MSHEGTFVLHLRVHIATNVDRRRDYHHLYSTSRVLWTRLAGGEIVHNYPSVLRADQACGRKQARSHSCHGHRGRESPR